MPSSAVQSHIGATWTPDGIICGLLLQPFLQLAPNFESFARDSAPMSSTAPSKRSALSWLPLKSLKFPELNREAIGLSSQWWEEYEISNKIPCFIRISECERNFETLTQNEHQNSIGLSLTNFPEDFWPQLNQHFCGSHGYWIQLPFFQILSRIIEAWMSVSSCLIVWSANRISF